MRGRKEWVARIKGGKMNGRQEWQEIKDRIKKKEREEKKKRQQTHKRYVWSSNLRVYLMKR